MKSILEAKQVDNLDSVKGEIKRAEGSKARKSLDNVKAKYAHVKLVRGLGANIFRLVDEGKFAVVIRCAAKDCNAATLVRTQDLFQVQRCTECRAAKKAKAKGGAE